MYGTLGRVRAALSELRSRINDLNQANELPDPDTRALVYAGQRLILEDNERFDQNCPALG